MFTHSQIKLSDMSPFTMCVFIYVHTSDLDVFDKNDQTPEVHIVVSCAERCCITYKFSRVHVLVYTNY